MSTIHLSSHPGSWESIDELPNTFFQHLDRIASEDISFEQPALHQDDDLELPTEGGPADGSADDNSEEGISAGDVSGERDSADGSEQDVSEERDSADGSAEEVQARERSFEEPEYSEPERTRREPLSGPRRSPEAEESSSDSTPPNTDVLLRWKVARDRATFVQQKLASTHHYAERCHRSLEASIRAAEHRNAQLRRAAEEVERVGELEDTLRIIRDERAMLENTLRAARSEVRNAEGAHETIGAEQGELEETLQAIHVQKAELAVVMIEAARVVGLLTDGSGIARLLHVRFEESVANWSENLTNLTQNSEEVAGNLHESVAFARRSLEGAIQEAHQLLEALKSGISAAKSIQVEDGPTCPGPSSIGETPDAGRQTLAALSFTQSLSPTVPPAARSPGYPPPPYPPIDPSEIGARLSAVERRMLELEQGPPSNIAGGHSVAARRKARTLPTTWLPFMKTVSTRTGAANEGPASASASSRQPPSAATGPSGAASYSVDYDIFGTSALTALTDESSLLPAISSTPLLERVQNLEARMDSLSERQLQDAAQAYLASRGFTDDVIAFCVRLHADVERSRTSAGSASNAGERSADVISGEVDASSSSA